MCNAKRACFIMIFLVFMVAISLAAEPKRRIGIITFSDQLRYLEAKRGFLDFLQETGQSGLSQLMPIDVI